MKKFAALLLAVLLALSCVLAASAEEAKTSINVCIASEPDTLDPALNSAVDGATMIAHLFAGLSTWAQDENGALVIVPACATELPAAVINDDGTAPPRLLPTATRTRLVINSALRNLGSIPGVSMMPNASMLRISAMTTHLS